MQARDLMTEDPICCTPSDLIRDVARKMADEIVGMLPVVDPIQGNTLIGIITDRDIVCRVVARDGRNCDLSTVQDAMTAGKFWTVHPDDSVDDVLDRMEEGQVRRVPVVDEQNRVVGIISTADIALELEEPEEIAEVFEEISEPSGIPHA